MVDNDRIVSTGLVPGDEADSLGQAGRPDIEVDVIRRRMGPGSLFTSPGIPERDPATPNSAWMGPDERGGVGDSRCARGRDGTGVQGFNEELFDRSFCDGLGDGMGVGTPGLAVGLIAETRGEKGDIALY